MRSCRKAVVVLSSIAALAGCASTPMGPTIQVMPAPNKPFEVFQQDVAICKDYASQQIAGQADRANERAFGGALLGTALGAGLGAAVDGGRGAGVGAAAGALLGTGVGASTSDHSQGGIQRQYDTAFAQCMYSKGNQVPGFKPITAPPPPGAAVAPVPAAPPVGTPPPPNAIPAPANLPPPPNP